MRLQNMFFGIFILLAVSCDNDTSANRKNKLVGTWQLSATYISPGGPTEWVDVDDGYLYIFDSDATFRKTESDGTAREAGSYRIEGNELFLEFEWEGEQKTIGYLLTLTDNTITLSPSFPAMCIEPCLSRFRRR